MQYTHDRQMETSATVGGNHLTALRRVHIGRALRMLLAAQAYETRFAGF